MAIELSKVDELRSRMQCSYEEAQNALAQANGDLLAALVDLERNRSSAVDMGGLAVELLDDVQRLLDAGGQIRKLRIRIGDKVMREIPLELTTVTAIVVAAVAILASRLAIDVIRD